MNHGKARASRNVRRVYQRWPVRRVLFFASRDIAAGEELQYDYGDKYWAGREDLLRD